MPGLVGFAGEDIERRRAVQALCAMTALVTDPQGNVWDEPFCDGAVSATRSHLAILQPAPQPWLSEADDLLVWMEGELFDTPAAAATTDAASGGQPALLGRLAGAALRSGRWDSLAALDGIYAAVVYDRARRAVHLISDRLGMRFLHWTVAGGRLAWASQSSAFLALPGFAPSVAQRTMDQFLSIGNLLGDATWLEGVECVSPGTVLSWDLRERRLSRTRYWWWDHIKPLGRPDPREVADELGRRVVASMARRCSSPRRVGLSLSGGLDSRCLLAAAPAGETPLVTLTFGKRGSPDVAVARRVARLKGAEAHFFELTSENWFAPRLDALWWTDGLMNFVDLHGVELRDQYRRLIDINLNGYGGDNFLNGDCLMKRRELERFDAGDIALSVPCDGRLLDGLEQYAPLGRSEYWLLEASERRWLATPQMFELTFAESRKPFVANDIVELLFGLPQSYRFRGRLYRAMLLRTFPLYFRTIPWANTGLAISLPRGSGRALKTWRALRARLSGAAVPGKPAGYADYAAWLRAEPARSFIEQTVLDPAALHRRYDPQGRVERLWAAHQAGADRSRELGRYVTAEVRLRQIFEGTFRPDLGAASLYEDARTAATWAANDRIAESHAAKTTPPSGSHST